MIKRFNVNLFHYVIDREITEKVLPRHFNQTKELRKLHGNKQVIFLNRKIESWEWDLYFV